jgi:hypothetical protein
MEEALGARGFRLAGVEPLFIDHESILDRVRSARPGLVILSEAPRFDGIGICEKLKSDPELRATRVVVLVDRPPDEVPLSRVAGAGADDIVLSRVPGEELYPVAARVSGLPDLSLSAPAEVRDPTWSQPSQPRKAEAANLSARSIDLLCERPFSAGAKIELQLRRASDDALVVEGQVARSDGGDGQPFRSRVLFSDMPSGVRQRLNDFCLWDSRALPGGGLRVEVRGAFDQACEFTILEKRIGEEAARGARLCIFDLSRVRQITSWGARAWILFLRSIPPGLTYRFVNGSTLFSRHCGMVADMLGRGEVVSLALPYECPGCGAERAHVVHVTWLQPSVRIEPPQFRCGGCGDWQRFAELPDRYFSFLKA